MALLVGIGIDQGILPILRPTHPEKSGKLQGWLPIIFLGYSFCYATINAYLSPNYEHLRAEQIAVMEWIEANTPETSRFLVISGQPAYGIDYVSEWFPVLAKRTSLTTPQAHEWLPDQEFNRRVRRHAELQGCAAQDLACIDSWAIDHGLVFTHIYLADQEPDDPRMTFPYLADSLKSSPDYRLLYDGDGGMVFALE